MISYLELLGQYINLPTGLLVAVVSLFLIIQAIGEIAELFGKSVPEFAKIRKRFKRKRDEEQELRDTIKETKEFLEDVRSHYSADNIAMRDGWMRAVNDGLSNVQRLSDKLDEIASDVLDQKIETMRNAILSFAARAADPNAQLTHEEFRRVFKIHDEYDKIIKKHNLKNGEVTVAMMVIQEAYQDRLRTRAFIEDVRGYGM